MNVLFPFCAGTIFSYFGSALLDPPANSSKIQLEINTPIGAMTIYPPTLAEIQKTASIAKSIFIEAFTTNYTDYYRQSGVQVPIEQWLKLKPHLTLQSWLNLVFDEEYKECLAGTKAMIYLCNNDGILIGWLSHSPMSEKGEMYLSQCSLASDFRNHRVATTAFEKVFQENYVKKLFPDIKEVKLIVRKINTIAAHLYIKSGFTMDETIDPSIYGESYDDRYVGFRRQIE